MVVVGLCVVLCLCFVFAFVFLVAGVGFRSDVEFVLQGYWHVLVPGV